MSQQTDIGLIYEQQIIATVLGQPDLIHEVEGLKPHHFKSRETGMMFKAMLDVAFRADEPDIINVTEVLINAHGGTHWLKTLGDLTTSVLANPANFKAYARIVQDGFQDRKTLQSANQYASDVKQGDQAALSNLITSLTDTHTDHHSDTKGSLGRVVQHLDDVQTGKVKPGIPTGIDKLDELFGGFHPGDLNILAGRPSIGKTGVLCNMTLKAGVPVGIISAEQPTDELMRRLISITGQLDSELFRTGKLKDSDWSKLTSAVTQLNDREICFYDNGSPTIEDVIQAAMQMKYRNDIGILFVDYIQRIEAPGENRNLQVGQVTWKLKALAKRLHIPIVALSQVSRRCEERRDKRPHLADLKESGDIEQDADLVMFLYRDAVYNDDIADTVMEIDVQKNRHGRIGRSYVGWDPAHLTISSNAERNASNGGTS